MIRIQRRAYEKLITELIYARDLRRLVRKFSVDRAYYFSVLKDISNGKRSPNYETLTKVARKKDLNEDFIVEQAREVLNFYVPYDHGQSPDYYKLLNVRSDASDEEIRRSWIELMKANHPDKAGPAGLDTSKKINEAYEVLRDTAKRDKYDRMNLPFIPVSVVTRSPYQNLYYAAPFVFIAVFAFLYVAGSGLLFKSQEEKERLAKVIENPALPNALYRGDSLASKGTVPDESETEGNLDGLTAAEHKTVKPADQVEPSNNVPSEKAELAKVAEAGPDKSEKQKAEIKKPQLAQKRTASVSETSAKHVQEEKKEKPNPPQMTAVGKRDVTESTAKEQDKEANSVTKETSTASVVKEDKLKQKTASDEPKPTESETSQYGEVYTVKPGDSLWTIARKFDTHIKDILRLNGMTDNKIRPGDEIIVSGKGVPAPPVKTETVKKTEADKKVTMSAKANQSVSPVKNRSQRTEPAKRFDPAISTTAIAAEKTNITKPELTPSVPDPDKNSLYGFVSEYVSAYKSGDVSRVKSLFAPDAVENGKSISTVLKAYSSNFAALEIISYDVKVKNASVYKDTGTVGGDFYILFKDQRTGARKNSHGRINWKLYWDSGTWKIKELSYKVEKTDS